MRVIRLLRLVLTSSLIILIASSCDQFSRPIEKEEREFVCGNAYEYDGPGKKIFQENCRTCHLKNARLEPSPPYFGLLDRREPGFLHRFLTQRKSLRKDSCIRANIKSYGSKCPEFPQFSYDESLLIEEFIRQRRLH